MAININKLDMNLHKLVVKSHHAISCNNFKLNWSKKNSLFELCPMVIEYNK